MRETGSKGLHFTSVFDSQLGSPSQRGGFFIGGLHPNQVGGNSRGYFQGAGISMFALTPSVSLAAKENEDRPFEGNPWVRAAIKPHATGLARLRFGLWTAPPKDKGATEIKGHAMRNLLRKPNLEMTEREFWIAHTTLFKLEGEVYWFFLDRDGRPVAANEERMESMPVQVLPVAGSNVWIREDSAGFAKAYRYQRSRGGYSEEFPRGAVVRFADFDPYNPLRGLGDIEGAMGEVDLYLQCMRYMDSSVRNGGNPGGVLIFEDKLSADELRVRQDLVDDRINGAQNAGRTVVTDARSKYVPNPVKPADMQFGELMGWLRGTILAACGTPPPVVGIYDDATLHNVETAYRELWSGPNGILSLATLTADVVQNKALPRLPLGGRSQVLPGADGPVAAFDHSHIEVLQEDFSEKVKRAAEIVQGGTGVSWDEALKLAGVEVEGPAEGQIRFIATGLETLEARKEADDRAATAPAEPSPAAAAPKGGKPAPGKPARQGERRNADKAARREWRPSRRLTDGVEGWLDRYGRAAVESIRSWAEDGQRLTSAEDGGERYTVDPDNIRESDLLGMVPSIGEWAEELRQLAEDPILGVWARTLLQAQREVGGPITRSTHPTVVRAARTQAVQLAEDVSGTVTKVVQRKVLSVLRGKEPAGSLRELIRRELPEITGQVAKAFSSNHQRALAISRTETGRATNSGRFIQFIDAGATSVRWRTSRDAQVRDSHSAIDGATVLIGQTFTNGLKHPHDPSAPAREVVNCRCSLDPVFDDDEDDLDDEDLDDDEVEE